MTKDCRRVAFAQWPMYSPVSSFIGNYSIMSHWEFGEVELLYFFSVFPWLSLFCNAVSAEYKFPMNDKVSLSCNENSSYYNDVRTAKTSTYPGGWNQIARAINREARNSSQLCDQLNNRIKRSR